MKLKRMIFGPYDETYVIRIHERANLQFHISEKAWSALGLGDPATWVGPKITVHILPPGHLLEVDIIKVEVWVDGALEGRLQFEIQQTPCGSAAVAVAARGLGLGPGPDPGFVPGPCSMLDCDGSDMCNSDQDIATCVSGHVHCAPPPPVKP